MPTFTPNAVRKDGVDTMGCGGMKVTCDDGFAVETRDKGELVRLVQWHLDHTHQKKASEAEIMAMSKHP